MTDETVIYRAAHEYIKQYGDDMDIQASMMADKMMARGGMEARAMWLQVFEAIGELRVLKRSSTEGIRT
ncbi:hypothetical protein N9748_00835 [bacterium]|nr:hypothetical protein [bacterium]